jgi:hypothetical protein
MRVGTERIECKHVEFHAGHIGLDACQNRVESDPRLLLEFAVPEDIEVSGTRRRESDLRWSHCGANGIKAVIAASVPAHVWDIRRGIRLHRDIQHARRLSTNLNPVTAGRQVQFAFLEHDRVIPANGPFP